MISFDDKRWEGLRGGDRQKCDPRPLLSTLEKSRDVKDVWHELWGELHHQGDVGEASYAAVPHLVRIYRTRGIIDWNIYAIVAVIELARHQQKNPPLPDWLERDYMQAIRELAETATVEALRATDTDELRVMLSVLAIHKGARQHADFLLNYSEKELAEFESRALEAGFL